MTFNSFEFAFFFTICFGLYWVLPQRAQNRMLLLASYVFYGSWNWKFLSLIAISTGVDYCIARALDGQGGALRRKWLLGISLATNLGILGVFKYANFFAESLQELLAQFGVSLSSLTIDVILPVGISFYTFQTLGYTIDVYRGRVAARRNLLDFALYVSFFPQLVAGPIERASSLLPQIESPRRFNSERFSSGSWLILWGLFKKVVIADNLAVLVELVYGPEAQPTSAEVLIATYAFAIQIYCDFSGYTDMARGLARLLGFELMENFRLPYFATDPADFWQRWHISLTTWFRDYVFIPLSFTPRGRKHIYLSLTIVWFLIGLWHGAAWTFVLWGLYNAILLIAHRAARPYLARLHPQSTWLVPGWTFVRWFTTFHLIAAGLMLFRAESLPALLGLLEFGFTNPGIGMVSEWALPFCVLSVPLLLFQIAQARSRNLEIVLEWHLVVRVLIYATIVVSIIAFGGSHGEPFVYFQF